MMACCSDIHHAKCHFYYHNATPSCSLLPWFPSWKYPWCTALRQPLSLQQQLLQQVSPSQQQPQPIRFAPFKAFFHKSRTLNECWYLKKKFSVRIFFSCLSIKFFYFFWLVYSKHLWTGCTYLELTFTANNDVAMFCVALFCFRT